MRVWIYVSVFLWSLCSFSQEKSSLEDRVSNLENKLNSLELRHQELNDQVVDGSGNVSGFFNDQIRLGGFLEHAITYVDGPDTDAQTSANTNILGLNLSAEWSEHLQVVAQVLTGFTYQLQNAHNNPNLTPATRQFGNPISGAAVVQGFAEYRNSRYLNIQIGTGYAPFGFAFQQREPVLFIRRGGPQMINSTGSDSGGAAFPLWMGIHLFGALPIENFQPHYSVYTFSPNTNPRTLGVGGRLSKEVSDNLSLGVSVQSAKEHNDPSFSHGFDIRFYKYNWGFISEYAHNQIFNKNLSVESYYFEPHLNWPEKHLLFYGAADYLSDPTYRSAKGTSFIEDPFKRWGYGAGINWLPISFTRFRLGYMRYQYVGDTANVNGQNRDFQMIDFSLGATF